MDQITLIEKRLSISKKGEEIVDTLKYSEEEKIFTKNMMRHILADMPVFEDREDLPKAFLDFTYIYCLVGMAITFDTYAFVQNMRIGFKNPDTKDMLQKASSSYSLVRRKGISNGYAAIIKDFMDYLDIPCECVSGKYLKARHMWNQVRINGEWFNVDCANDSDSLRLGLIPKNFLQSDEEFRKRNKEVLTSNKNSCVRSLDYSKCESIINEMRAIIIEKYPELLEIQRDLTIKPSKRTIKETITDFIRGFELLEGELA